MLVVPTAFTAASSSTSKSSSARPLSRTGMVSTVQASLAALNHSDSGAFTEVATTAATPSYTGTSSSIHASETNEQKTPKKKYILIITTKNQAMATPLQKEASAGSAAAKAVVLKPAKASTENTLLSPSLLQDEEITKSTTSKIATSSRLSTPFAENSSLNHLSPHSFFSMNRVRAMHHRSVSVPAEMLTNLLENPIKEDLTQKVPEDHVHLALPLTMSHSQAEEALGKEILHGESLKRILQQLTLTGRYCFMSYVVNFWAVTQGAKEPLKDNDPIVKRLKPMEIKGKKLREALESLPLNKLTILKNDLINYWYTQGL